MQEFLLRSGAMDPAPDLPSIRRYSGGIAAVDTQLVRPEMAASFIMTEGDRAAFVEAGTARATEGLLKALEHLEISPDQVDYVIVTHVHLDHAGGAGTLMKHLPAARLVVHPRGARHMIDPSRLIQGATAVYGEAEFKRQFDTLEPIPEDRVLVADDGDSIELAGRRLEFLDSPGHAKHHFCVWDDKTRGFFTGDTFGLSYREFDTDQGVFIFPTTTPIDFDPQAMHDSIERMLAFNPRCLYLTHYGRVDDPGLLAPAMHRRIDAMADIARGHGDAGEKRYAWIYRDMERYLLEELAAHGVTLPESEQRRLLAVDLQLNAQGLVVWLDRQSGH